MRALHSYHCEVTGEVLEQKWGRCVQPDRGDAVILGSTHYEVQRSRRSDASPIESPTIVVELAEVDADEVGG